MWHKRYKYDVFVSHAVEDKLPIANELCQRLEAKGLKIWYSGKELRVGDSLEATIVKALEESRYGVVILSPTYLQKNWTRKEYYLLMAKEIAKRKVILPVLYDITNEELARLDIHIADKWAIPSTHGLDIVVEKLMQVIDDKSPLEGKPLTNIQKVLIGALSLICIVSGFFWFSNILSNRSPSDQFVNASINHYISDQDSMMADDYRNFILQSNAKESTLEEINHLNNDFTSLNTRFRNEYKFEATGNTITAKKNVEAALAMPLTASMSPTYDLVEPKIHLTKSESNGKLLSIRYTFKNTKDVNYTIRQSHANEDDYEVSVVYENNVRYIFVSLIYPPDQETPKRRKTELKGFAPAQKFVFHRQDGDWMFKGAEEVTR